MRGRYRQAEAVRSADHRRCDDFSRSALAVGQVGLADFLADSDDDPLPADHGAHAERDGDGDFHPGRDELRRVVDALMIGVDRQLVLGCDRRLARLLHQPQRFAGQVHVVTDVAYLFRRDLVDRLIDGNLIADILGQRLDRRDGFGGQRMGADITANLGAGVGGSVALGIVGQHGRCLIRRRHEGRDLIFMHRTVQRVGGGHGADQDQHDQAHALLAVVGAVEEADQRAGDNQQRPDRQRRRGVALGGLVERRHLDQALHDVEQSTGQDEAEGGRSEQRIADLGRLTPIDAAGAVHAAHQLVHQADTDDRADQRMRTG